MCVYDFTVKNIDGQPESLSRYEGKVVLIVNTASKCGFTPQYKGLQALYEKYRDLGLEILGFPCNQFGQQEPGTNEEIQQFCDLNYNVSFPMFAKVDVNGASADPLFQHIKKEAKGALGSQAIKWNFTKFLVDRKGNVLKRFAPQTEPEKLTAEIEEMLKLS